MTNPIKRIFEFFERIHAAKGRNLKVAIIEELIAETELNSYLTEILQHTYDPYITFGVTATMPTASTSLIQAVEEDGLLEHWTTTKEVLSKLAARSLTGNAAQYAIEEIIRMTPAPYRKWWVGIINRNLRISGVAASTWAKYIPGLTTNVNPQLCDKFDNRTIVEPMYVEPKYDGIRAVFVPQENGTVIAFSREGKRLFNTERLCDLIAKSDNNKIVVDGEVFYKDFHTTQSIVSTQSEHPLAVNLQLFAFDAIPLEDWNAQTSSLPLFRRKEVLRAVVDDINEFERPPKPTVEEVKAKLEEIAKKGGIRGVAIPPPLEEPKDDPSWPVQYVPAKLIGSNAAAEAFYRECVAAGFEGIILKEHNCHYEYKRTKTWMKMKPSHDTDITIVDAIEGNHRLVGSLGALIVEGSVTFNNRPHKVRTEVGSGFTDVLRQKLWDLHKAGELVGRIVEVRYQEPDIDGALRFPVFVRLRDDRAEEAA
jgi:hypothetical protein